MGECDLLRATTLIGVVWASAELIMAVTGANKCGTSLAYLKTKKNISVGKNLTI